MEKQHKQLLTEISVLTREIEEKYPELLKYLNETRSTLPKEPNSDSGLSFEDLENYKQQLQTMIAKYNPDK
ncbi:hypothetical protein ACFQ1Q_05030 [Winogradskyella litorisediminis]|uniref:Uncharacterized protein n=1 Tax=Winogradskyella litorisediminis TaxID=1156618 RepID=A0ABW3N4N5_9FLAO